MSATEAYTASSYDPLQDINNALREYFLNEPVRAVLNFIDILSTLETGYEGVSGTLYSLWKPSHWHKLNTTKQELINIKIESAENPILGAVAALKILYNLLARGSHWESDSINGQVVYKLLMMAQFTEIEHLKLLKHHPEVFLMMLKRAIDTAPKRIVELGLESGIPIIVATGVRTLGSRPPSRSSTSEVKETQRQILG